jgi:NADH-quinone oxidoreductase subunit N
MAAAEGATTTESLARARDFIAKLVALFAVITCTFGNLAAYGQTNIKRLLAYSTIAHAGYMMMPVPAMLAMAQSDPGGAREAAGALGLYIAVYLFMNLGAFAVVAFLRNAMRSEEIRDYAGLIRRAPGVAVCFSLILFGLIGLPPLSGFVGKFAVFASLVDGYQTTGQTYLLVLLVIGGINTAISLFYYLNVVKVMTIDAEPRERLPFAFPLVSLPGMFILAITLPTAALILGWDSLNEFCLAAARHLLT